MSATSWWRGHQIICKDDKWLYADNLEPTVGYGGKERPCGKCGGEPGREDACLGMLPGVDNACCGHGVREESFIQFTNGVVVRGFVLDALDKEE